MKIFCIIPARLQSTRLPRKVLAKIGGMTMIEHVWRTAKQCKEFAEVYVAVDSSEVAEEVDRFGGKWGMTSPACPTGTHRLIEFVQKEGLKGDVFVNWQGDNPFVPPQMIKDLLQGIYNPVESIWTLMKDADKQDVANPNVVKVVTDRYGRALYFSRSAIPFDRDGIGCNIKKHIGLYAYRWEALLKIAALPVTPLAEVEKLEQLGFLENGLSINVYPTQYESIGVDTHQDLVYASSIINFR